MPIFYILLVSYAVAVNVYSVTLFLSVRGEYLLDESKPYRGDGKIILSALLGGAPSIYATMFITKFKLKDAVLMILMPVISALNVWMFIVAFRSAAAYIVV